ncbi:MAG: hypothetical protein JW795_03415 [Chitinivibrionales bacterium]|nr:hypothetical protein [Chitinivibrionales bacterium]
MKLSLKDIITIAVVSVLSFPLVYFSVLVATGNATIVFGRGSNPLASESNRELKIMRQSNNRDSLMVQQTEIFLANQREKEEIAQQHQKLLKQQERITLVNQELVSTKESLDKKQKEIEQLLLKSDAFESKKIKQLAKVYGAMRPQEAATILETLDDNLCIQIFEALNDDRQKGKILPLLSKEKAQRLSQKMAVLVSEKTVKPDKSAALK